MANWDWDWSRSDKKLKTFIIILLVSKFFGELFLTWFFCVQIKSVKHGQCLLSISVLKKIMNIKRVN